MGGKRGNRKNVAPVERTVTIYIALEELIPCGEVEQNLDVSSGDSGLWLAAVSLGGSGGPGEVGVGKGVTKSFPKNLHGWYQPTSIFIHSFTGASHRAHNSLLGRMFLPTVQLSLLPATPWETRNNKSSLLRG